MSFATGLKTIVVATELNGRPEAALEYARKLVAAYGTRIALMACSRVPVLRVRPEAAPAGIRPGACSCTCSCAGIN